MIVAVIGLDAIANDAARQIKTTRKVKIALEKGALRLNKANLMYSIVVMESLSTIFFLGKRMAMDESRNVLQILPKAFLQS